MDFTKLPGLLAGQGLVEDPERSKALQRGLMGAAFQLLASRGRFGESLGRAGMAGMSIFDQAMQDAQQRTLHDLRVKGLQQQQAAQAATLEQQQRLRDLAQQFRRSPAQGALAAGAQAGSVGPTNANAARVADTPAGFDFEGYADALAGVDPSAALDMHKTAAEVATKRRELGQGPKVRHFERIQHPDGRVEVVGIDEYGKPVNTGQRPFIAPEIRSMGGYMGAIDPVTQAVRNLGLITMSQAERDASARGWTNARTAQEANRIKADENDINREAQRTQIVDDPILGPTLVDKGRGTGRPVTLPSGNTMQGENTIKAQKGASDVLDLLTEAKQHVAGATGSWIGAGVDQGARAFGHATPGAQSIARLKVIEAGIMSKMPRMEGPQSNLDVQLYREAAGQIGNPTVPREQKLAAIQTIEALQSRYAGVVPGASWAPGAAPAGGGRAGAGVVEWNSLPGGR